MTTNKCSTCGFISSPFAKNCEKCGLPFVSEGPPVVSGDEGSPSKLCPICSFENDATATKCTLCGADMAPPPTKTSDSVRIGSNTIRTSSNSVRIVKPVLAKSNLPKLCPSCNWKNDYDDEYCKNCNTKLPMYLSEPTEAPPPKFPYLAVLLWTILVAIVIGTGALIYYKVIVPIARENRQLNVQATMKKLGVIAFDFASNNSGMYWENGTYQFGDTKVKHDYKFYYFGDDADDDGKHTSTVCVFIAIPIHAEEGVKAYFIDELRDLYFAEIPDEQSLSILSSITYDDIRWYLTNRATKPSRCDIGRIVFKLLYADK